MVDETDKHNSGAGPTDTNCSIPKSLILFISSCEPIDCSAHDAGDYVNPSIHEAPSTPISLAYSFRLNHLYTSKYKKYLGLSMQKSIFDGKCHEPGVSETENGI
jgi:hypothetical protein